MSLFRTKSVETMLAEREDPKHQLKRVLGAFDLVSIGIGCIIGTGIFVLTGVAASRYSGPALIVSFIIAGLACAFAALAYAEFASMIPLAGSAYTYSYATLGELLAWIIGWDLILEYGVAASAVAVGWSAYFTNIANNFLQVFNIKIPMHWVNAPWAASTIETPKLIDYFFKPELWQNFDLLHLFAASTVPTGDYFNLPAVIIILLITTLLVIGIRESANVNTIIVSIKVVVVLFFIFLGVWFIKPVNWIPFAPFGWGGIMTGAAIIFFAYIGFDAVSTAAEETKNPQRDLPIGIIGSLIICTILYIAVAAIMTGIVPFNELGTAAPMAYVFEKINMSWASGLISLGAICGITSVLMITLFGQSRLFFAMSRDNLLPAFVSAVHPKFKTPALITIITGTVMAVLAAITPIEIIAELANIGTLFAFILVSGGIMVLRKTRPDLKRVFKCPWVPVIPILAILFCFYLMISLPIITWVRFVVWLLIGFIIYFSYSRFHSKLAHKEVVNEPVELKAQDKTPEPPLTDEPKLNDKV